MSGILSHPGVEWVDMGGKRVWTKPDTNGWLPIETAPRDGTMFIGTRMLMMISNGDGPAEAEYLVSDARWQDGRYRFRDIRSGTPTHWRPFEAPEGA